MTSKTDASSQSPLPAQSDPFGARNPAYDGPDGIFAGYGEAASPDQRLEDACCLGDATAADRALADGADVRANHSRAAWLARERGHEDLFDKLVKAGVDPRSHA